MGIPLFSSEVKVNLMNYLPVRLNNIILLIWGFTATDNWVYAHKLTQEALIKLTSSTLDPLVVRIAGRHTFNYLPSFLFRYIERLVVSLFFTFSGSHRPRY